MNCQVALILVVTIAIVYSHPQPGKHSAEVAITHEHDEKKLNLVPHEGDHAMSASNSKFKITELEEALNQAADDGKKGLKRACGCKNCNCKRCKDSCSSESCGCSASSEECGCKSKCKCNSSCSCSSEECGCKRKCCKCKKSCNKCNKRRCGCH